jgi:FkbM family methyltransferase
VTPKSRLRHFAKLVLGRVLPAGLYQRALAASIVRDLRAGILSEPELELVDHLAEPGEAVVDIGANHGMWTVRLSEAVGPSGRVHAFEPVPYTAGTLRRVIAAFGLENVVLAELGCSDRAGRATFRVPIQDSGVTDAALAHLATGSDRERARDVEVELVVLDDFLDERRPISMLKIDVEGAELLSLRGAVRLLERDRPTVIAEIAPELMERFGIEAGELASLFDGLGYEAFRLDPGGLLEPATLSGDLDAGNAIFVHPTRRSRLAGRIAG